MKIDERHTLASNPFWLSELIGFFNQGYGDKAPFELVYLAAPLILRQESRRKISSLNSTSTIYSAFLESKEKRTKIAGLQKHVESYKHLVIPSLIVYSNKGNKFGLQLQNGKKYQYNKVDNKQVREYCKAAYILGKIFAKESTKECFYKLGVFSL